MSPLARPSERAAALREKHEQEQRQAQIARQQNMSTEKSPTGIVRRKPDIDQARSSLDAPNRKVNEALDRVREAFQREAQLNQADTAQTADDSRRAPVLKNRRAR